MNLDIKPSSDNELQIIQDTLLHIVTILFPLVMQEEAKINSVKNKTLCHIHNSLISSSSELLCRICIKKILITLNGAFQYCFFVIKKYTLFKRGQAELLDHMREFSHYNLAIGYRNLVQNMADLFSIDTTASKAIILHDLSAKTIHISNVLDEIIIKIWQELFFIKVYLTERLFFKPYFLNINKKEECE